MCLAVSGMLCHMTMNARLAELGQRVRARRIAANLSIDAAAKKGDVSPVTWSRVELGRPVRELTFASVERVLSWPPGACRAYLDTGKEPPKTVTGKAHFGPGIATDPDPDEEWREQIIAEGLAAARKTLGGMDRKEAEELIETMRTYVAGWRARRGDRQDRQRNTG